MQIEKLLSLLGLARKAGRVNLGYDQAEGAVYSQKAYAVFYASDVSARVQRNLKRCCEQEEVPLVKLPVDMVTLSAAVGQKTGVVTVKDSGFATRALELSAVKQ